MKGAKKMKKNILILTLILGVALVSTSCSVLAGLGESDASQDDTSAPNAETKEDSSTAEEAGGEMDTNPQTGASRFCG